MGKTLAFALPMPPLPLGPQAPVAPQAGGGSSSMHSVILKRPSSSNNTADQDRVDILNSSEAALLTGLDDPNKR